MVNIETIDTSGLYKLDGTLLYAPNFVLNVNYELRREMHAEYNYPTDGWVWCDSLAEAEALFNVKSENTHNEN